MNILSAVVFYVSAFLLPVNAAEITNLTPNKYDLAMVLISGPIVSGDSEKFYELTRNIDRAVVLLDSPGGHLDDGISIAAEIAHKQFATSVAGMSGCHSICATIWVAGARRYMNYESKVSVHAAYYKDNTVSGGFAISGRGNAKLGAFLNELGLDLRAIEYFTAVNSPEEKLLPITPDIARLLNIDVILQGNDFMIEPRDRPTPSSIAYQAAQLGAMEVHCSLILNVQAGAFASRLRAKLEEANATFGIEPTFSK